MRRLSFYVAHRWDFVTINHVTPAKPPTSWTAAARLGLLAHSPVLLWMVLTVVVVRGGDDDLSDTHSSSCEQPFSMART